MNVHVENCDQQIVDVNIMLQMWQTGWFGPLVPLPCFHTMQWGLSTFANSLFTELNRRCQTLIIQICFLLSDFRFTNWRKESVPPFGYVGGTECIS